MPDIATAPFLRTLRWLAAHTGFPASRLPSRPELLVLIATAAAADGEPASPGSAHRKIVHNANFSAQLRNYTAQRRRAHLTVDNSAKT